MTEKTTRRKWTAEEVGKLAKLIDEGKTYGEIAEIFGSTYIAVLNLAKRNGIRNNPRRWTDADRRIAAIMLALGYTFAETGEALGRTEKSVHEQRHNGTLLPDQIIRSIDRRGRRTGPWSSGESELLMLLTAKGWENARIAKLLARTVGSVEAKKNDRGIVGHRYSRQSKAGIWRPCMMCQEKFLSEGVHNRICLQCKDTDAWKYGGAYCD